MAEACESASDGHVPDLAPARGTQPGPLAVFDDWAAQERLRGEFDGGTVAVYRSIWQAWLSWLGTRPLPWDAVDEATVRAFLDGPPPTGRSRAAHQRHEPMANYTRQRYYRVLRGVYQHAVRRQVLALNPVLALQDDEVPTIDARSRSSQVLPPGVLDALRDPAALRALLGVATPARWSPLRDGALITLLATTAITTREAVALTGEDLRVGTVQGSDRLAQRLVSAPGLAPNLALLPGEGVWLVLQDSDELLGRSLPVPVTAWPALLAWAQAREALLPQPGLSARAALFLSRQRRRRTPDGAEPGALPRGVPDYPAMDSASVWVSVRRVLDPLLARHAGSSGAVDVARGAAIIRNSVLQEWVDAVGPLETARRAGLSSPAHLRVFARRGGGE